MWWRNHGRRSNHVDTVHECDRQTDRITMTNTVQRIASHGINCDCLKRWQNNNTIWINDQQKLKKTTTTTLSSHHFHLCVKSSLISARRSSILVCLIWFLSLFQCFCRHLYSRARATYPIIIRSTCISLQSFLR